VSGWGAALPHPLLVADIGGTNARVGVVDAPGQTPRIVARFATKDAGLPTAETALRRAISLSGVSPRAAALAVAGPVLGRSAELTNAGWSFDGPALAKALGLEQGLLVNDFEALAAVLPALGSEDLAALKAGVADEGARLVLGPGTGFGAAALVGRDGRFSILQTEAGHMELGPVSEREFGLWPHIARLDGRITIERLLSGDGLARLDAALRRAAGRPSLDGDAARIVELAHHGDAAARDAILAFATLLGRVAGDLALACKATGGVFIAGGVLPRLLPLVDLAAMGEAFVAKPPMTKLMGKIPLHMIVGPDPAERGLALAAAEPEAFGLGHRLWV
jgi:glucokinase